MADVSVQDATCFIDQDSSFVYQELAQQAGNAQPSKPEEPIVRSPTSTSFDEEPAQKAEAPTLSAAYRARIALAAASPAQTTAPASAMPRATPAARLLTFVNSPLPTPTVHGNDTNNIQLMEKKWKMLYGSMRSNSQAAADVLMKQAQATSQLEELVQLLFIQLKTSADERARLQQVVLTERAQLMAAAEAAVQLQQRLHTSEHRSTAVAVVQESMQSQLTQTREALEGCTRERQQLVDHVRHLAEQLSVTTECRTRGDALIAEQNAVIETLRQQLQEQASAAAALAEDKAQLELQLQSVLRAEQELTGHLRETHAAIEGQLMALREQLKTERQKRAVVVKRRGELQAQVESLQGQLAAEQAEMATLVERLARGAYGPAQHPFTSRTTSGAAGGNAHGAAAKSAGHGAATSSRGATAAAHATHARASGVASAGAAGSGSAAPTLRSRSVARPNSAVAGGVRGSQTSSSPTNSVGNGGGGVRRSNSTVSPRGPISRSGVPADETSPAAVIIQTTSLPPPAGSSAVPLFVPSSLSSSHAPTSGATPPPKLFFDSHERYGTNSIPDADVDNRDSTTLAAAVAALAAVVADGGATESGPSMVPSAAAGRARSGAVTMEPASPPICFPLSAREDGRGLAEHGGGAAGGRGPVLAPGGGCGGANSRRRSTSPEPSRASAIANSTMHVRRPNPALAAGNGMPERGGKVAPGRVSSPAVSAMGNTWLP